MTISSQNETLEAEKVNLIATVERKNQEIDRLNGERVVMIALNCTTIARYTNCICVKYIYALK